MAFIKSCSIDSRNEQSPTCEVVHETNKAHFISVQQISCLAQLVEHWPYDPEVLVSIPTGDNFWWIFLPFPVCKIIWQKRLLWKTQLTRKSSCMNARGIPTTAYQVLPLLPEVGYPPAGVPQPGLMGVPKVGVPPGRGTPPRCGQTENITFPHPLHAVGNNRMQRQIVKKK